MHFRWWNSFTILAVILVAIGVLGVLQGDRMVFDPGRPSTGKEGFLYLIAGGLMLVNGLLPSGPPSPEDNERAQPRRRRASTGSDDGAASE